MTQNFADIFSADGAVSQIPLQRLVANMLRTR